jgi:hypothetical protein
LRPAGTGEPGGNLPALQEKPWEGHFVGWEKRGYRFGIGCDGIGEITPLTRRGDPIAKSKVIKVSFVIEETGADGKVTARQIRPDSLETSNEATTEEGAVTFHGEATGDAKFEVVASFEDGRVELGGRITEPGGLEGKLQFSILTYFRSIYSGSDLEDRDFQKKVRGDEIKFETVEGEDGKIEMIEKVDLEELCGDGLRAMKLEQDGYERRRFEFDASENSVLTLESSGGKPLISGFTMTWRADAEKDPEGRARFGFQVR